MFRRILSVVVGFVFVVGVLVVAWGPGRGLNATDAAAPAAAPSPQPAKAVTPALPPLPADVAAKADKSLAAGVRFLLKGQQPDGSWGAQFGPAITAMAVKALVQAGEPVDSPAVKKAVEFILSKQTKAEGKLNGAFADQALANYNTAICLSTLVLLDGKLKDKPYDAAVKAGLAFLRRDQWDESEGIDKNSPNYGGFGYGNGERPDMSNTGTTMDALKALQDAGYITQDDPMYAKVQVFLEHSQNRSESNKINTFAVSNDNGFIYTPAVSPKATQPESKAGFGDAKSSLKSYGSMTYQGFKSYVYSGLPKGDPRVRDAFGWIVKHYTLNENPGVGPEGLFYYYHTMARALTANGEAKITDTAGVAHDWRAEMIAKLAGIQKEDGSWVNDKASRWEEGNPVLATCFAMLAMEETAGR